jgi:hypothetical protein
VNMEVHMGLTAAARSYREAVAAAMSRTSPIIWCLDAGQPHSPTRERNKELGQKREECDRDFQMPRADNTCH